MGACTRLLVVVVQLRGVELTPRARACYGDRCWTGLVRRLCGCTRPRPWGQADPWAWPLRAGL
eukprot:13077992-Alexandrium_andersonii.AAC.1